MIKWVFVCLFPSSTSCLSLADSGHIRYVFRFCPWELPLRPPVHASPAMYPLSVPQWEIPTWRENQQMVPCWNTFPLPFILLSYYNNLESLPTVPEDSLCGLQPVCGSFLVLTTCHISCEKQVCRVWDLHELNEWIGEHIANCFVYTYFSLICSVCITSRKPVKIHLNRTGSSILPLIPAPLLSCLFHVSG